MAEVTGISWARSTLNPWIGCTKIGPGCDHCYAETLDLQRLSKSLGGGTPSKPIIHWGAGAPRYRTKPGNWRDAIRWNKQAPGSVFAGRVGFWPVFCASLADVFDNEVPDEWRSDLFDLIDATPNLTWFLVTKRIGNVRSMIPGGWSVRFPDHVRLLITVCSAEEAHRDIPKLLDLNCKNGVSYEPALGPVNWGPYLSLSSTPGMGLMPGFVRNGIQWIIVGGESTQGGAVGRAFDIGWARKAVSQCYEAGVPVFVKQLGSAPEFCDKALALADRVGGEISEWPEDLRVQEFPL